MVLLGYVWISHSPENEKTDLAGYFFTFKFDDFLLFFQTLRRSVKLYPHFDSLALCVLLAALDSTIVSTALSTIQRDLNGTSASLTWITQSYLLLCTCLAPSYGKISQLYGRKVVLFSSIGFFLLGSLLCALAKNMIWLCASRGVQGIGGGGIVQLTQVSRNCLCSKCENRH